MMELFKAFLNLLASFEKFLMFCGRLLNIVIPTHLSEL
jgi:hypothetical protein